MARTRSIGLLALLIFVTGCLPSSCRREEHRDLFPADSLSRHIAEALPIDTLALRWQVLSSDEEPLAYPRTIRFAENGDVYVSDVERNSVFVFAEDGAFREEITSEAFAFPYLAGWRGDSLLVFNPMDLRIDWVSQGTVVQTTPLPDDLDEGGRLAYATAAPDGFYFKGLKEDAASFVAKVKDDGTEEARQVLGGPVWRYAGLLKRWNDRMISLSGYRPLLDMWEPNGSLDSLHLVGFDSPMLARSRAFMIGAIDEAPLLSSSAAPVDSLLFVLNMRPGWLHIDAFDWAGELQHRLTEPNPVFNTEFYPIDVAVRPVAGHGYHIAVAIVKPRPRIDVYFWQPSP